MILSEVRNHIRQHGKVTLPELTEHFDSSPESLREMLDFLIGKGFVHREFLTPSCSGCSAQCDRHGVEIFLWGKQSISGSRPEASACGYR